MRDYVPANEIVKFVRLQMYQLASVSMYVDQLADGSACMWVMGHKLAFLGQNLILKVVKN